MTENDFQRFSVMKMLNLTVLSPEKQVFQGKVLSVKAPATEGEIEIYVGHAPFLAVLSAGYMVIQCENGTEKKYFLTSGYLDVHKSVTIIADNIMDADSVTSEFIQSQIDFFEKKLHTSDHLDDVAFNHAADSVARYKQL